MAVLEAVASFFGAENRLAVFLVADHAVVVSMVKCLSLILCTAATLANWIH